MKIDLANFEKKDFQLHLKKYLTFASQDACSHALGLAELQAPEVQMFTARDDTGALMGCAALKRIGASQGEVKSVSTHENFLRRGVSKGLMVHLESQAKSDGLTTLFLETHNTPPYEPACRLYENLGYVYCGPFGEYTQTSRNVFMVKTIYSD